MPPPPGRPLPQAHPRRFRGVSRPRGTECGFIASCLWQGPFLRAQPGPKASLQGLLCLIFPFHFLFFPLALQQH